MSLHLEWVFKCCVCKKEHREKAVTTTLICDSDPVHVKQPTADGWESDGLGGWMCKSCYKEWSKK